MAFNVNQDLSDRVAETIMYEKYLGTVFDDEITPTEQEKLDLDGSTYFRIK